MTSQFQNIDAALPRLADKIMHEGDEVGSRLGERTMEILHEQIVLEKPWQREVLVKDRNANIVAQIAETMWVLAGRNDVGFLGHYLPRAKDFSDDGETWRGGYGPRLRAWFDPSQDALADIDQIEHIVNVLSQDRLSRRAVVSIYDPGVDTAPGKDIPCNDFLSFISRKGRLDLSVFVRSNDLVWGWSGINAFEWSALQEIVAGLLGLEVGHLIFNTTSLHIYDRHWPRADRFAEDPLAVAFPDSPRFKPAAEVYSLAHVDGLIKRWFHLEEKIRTGGAWRGAEVDTFPEPMMRSWLQVIAWYWTSDEEYLKPIMNSRLWAATQQVPKSVKEHVQGQRVKPLVDESGMSAGFGMAVAGTPSGPNGEYQAGDRVTLYAVTTPPPAFIEYVDNLHREKGAAYGGSWKRRGEQMSILANIARKVDRLDGGVETSDETQADTAVDLLVYLMKYRLWLSETNPELSLPMLNAGDEYADLRAMLEWLYEVGEKNPLPELLERTADSIYAKFSELERVVTEDPHRKDDSLRAAIVSSLLLSAFMVAYDRWTATNPDA